MAAKNRGISPDLLIHPGETIADLLEERSLSQKELAQRAGVSEAFLSDVIHGKKDISRGLAMGLEYALGVPCSFWLNLQANYDAEVLNLKEEETVNDEEKNVLKTIHAVAEYLEKMEYIQENLSEEAKIIELRRLFQISDLTGLAYFSLTGALRISGKAAVDPYVMGAWLCMCQAMGRGRTIKTEFEPSQKEHLISDIKNIMCAHSVNIQHDLRSLFSNFGIDFSIAHNFRGAPVHGYISKKDDNKYQMVLTIRGAYADIFWFSLFHELGHIYNGDISKPGILIDAQEPNDGNREAAADQFAADALLSPDSYRNFLEKGDFSYPVIEKFAQSQSVPSFVVIGRLQKEKYISWNKFNTYKPRYKWA